MVHPAGNTILKTCLLNDHIRRCQVIIVGMLPTPRFVRPIGLLLTSAQFVRLRSHDLPCHEWHQQSTVYSNDLSCIYAYMWRQNEFMVEFERISSKMKIKKFIRITTVSRLLLNQWSMAKHCQMDDDRPAGRPVLALVYMYNGLLLYAWWVIFVGWKNRWNPTQPTRTN